MSGERNIAKNQNEIHLHQQNANKNYYTYTLSAEQFIAYSCYAPNWNQTSQMLLVFWDSVGWKISWKIWSSLCLTFGPLFVITVFQALTQDFPERSFIYSKSPGLQQHVSSWCYESVAWVHDRLGCIHLALKKVHERGQFYQTSLHLGIPPWWMWALYNRWQGKRVFWFANGVSNHFKHKL